MTEPIIISYLDGSSVYEWANDKKQLHNDKGPAYIEFNRNKEIIETRYYINDKLHQDDGPAICVYQAGKLVEEYYLVNGIHTKENAPATIYYYDDGTIKQIFYFKNGHPHRDDGPAVIEYNRKGKIIKREYKYYSDDLYCFRTFKELKAFIKVQILK